MRIKEIGYYQEAKKIMRKMNPSNTRRMLIYTTNTIENYHQLLSIMHLRSS